MPLDNISRVALPAEDIGYLTSRAEEKLRVEFHKRDHKPSEETWRSLRALLGNLESQARGTAAPMFSLSSLYCGAGKTSALAAFMDAMLECREFDHVGALILVPRLDLIAPLVAEMKLPIGWLAVLTSDQSVNALGTATDPNSARVLISSHQRLIQRCLKGGNFASMTDLYFNGTVRSVRVVDESILPADAISLTSTEALAVPLLLQAVSPQLSLRMLDIFAGIQAHAFGPDETRRTIDLPDYVAESGIDLNQALRSARWKGGDAGVRNLTALWMLSGRTITSRKNHRGGATVLDYKDAMPADFAPALILDASGGVRGTYAAWAEGRGNLTMLPSNAQNYSPMTVNVWARGGSKSSMRAHALDLCTGVAETVRKVIAEEARPPWFLFVVHGATSQYDCEKTIRAMLPLEGKFRVSFTTWGRADASNEFRDCTHVFLVGTLFYSPSQYEALARAAAGKPSSEGDVDAALLDRVVAGEHRHKILQAALRGRARQSAGDRCKPMSLYVIASSQSGIPAALPELFGGCTMKRWRPSQKPLDGKPKEAQAAIENWLEWSTPAVKPGDFLSFKTVQDAIDLRLPVAFRNVVRRHQGFIDWLELFDIHEASRKAGGKSKQGWIFEPPASFFGF